MWVREGHDRSPPGSRAAWPVLGLGGLEPGPGLGPGPAWARARSQSPRISENTFFEMPDVLFLRTVQAPAPRVTAVGTHTCRHLVDGAVACSSLLPLCLAFVGSLQAGQHNKHVMSVQPFLLLHSLLFFATNFGGIWVPGGGV